MPLALLIAGAGRGDGSHARHNAHAPHAPHAAAHGHQHHHAHVLDLGTTPPSRAITISFIALVVFTIAFEHLEHRMMHALSKQGRKLVHKVRSSVRGIVLGLTERAQWRCALLAFSQKRERERGSASDRVRNVLPNFPPPSFSCRRSWVCTACVLPKERARTRVGKREFTPCLTQLSSSVL